MHLPKLHALGDIDAAFTLVQSHPLGAWVCHTENGLVANHVPFFLDRTRGTHGTLIGHVSRANAVWQHLTPDAPSVVIFQGPQAYISPNWYPGKTAHGKVVPTWNYVVADAPAEYIERLTQAIVGIEIPIDRVEGKQKTSQDEDLQDRLGTVNGLQAHGGDATRAMATWVMGAITAEGQKP